ncbi:MAG: hypothetical protein LBI98_02800 [Endomicrobium sp.]|nr:hypothetical protein [Endomicrobium sp.]
MAFGRVLQKERKRIKLKQYKVILCLLSGLMKETILILFLSGAVLG